MLPGLIVSMCTVTSSCRPSSKYLFLWAINAQCRKGVAPQVGRCQPVVLRQRFDAFRSMRVRSRTSVQQYSEPSCRKASISAGPRRVSNIWRSPEGKTFRVFLKDHDKQAGKPFSSASISPHKYNRFPMPTRIVMDKNSINAAVASNQNKCQRGLHSS